jgi:hypothetical protein
MTLSLILFVLFDQDKLPPGVRNEDDLVLIPFRLSFMRANCRLVFGTIDDLVL